MNKKIVQEFVITENTNERVDIYLATKLSLSRSNIQGQIKAKLIEINGMNVVSKQKLQMGDKVSIFEAERKNIGAKNVPIIFEDDDILVINKPAGISVHPAPGEKNSTIYDLFKNKFVVAEDATISIDEYPLIVHRLDKGTSGVMVLVKNLKSREILKAQFKDRLVKKQYLALLFGVLNDNAGKIDLPIDRDEKNRGRFAVISSGREAVTEFEVIEKIPDYTLINAYPKTGRTHQIRVHFSSIGFPLMGDKRYNSKIESANILLHAFKISFTSPNTGKLVEFAAPVPAGYLLQLKELGFSTQTLSKLS